MIKKITKIALLAALTSASVTYAGVMGDSSGCNGGACSSAFFALEGGYSRINMGRSEFVLFNGGAPFLTVSATRTNDNVTGRLSAGMISMMDDQVGFTGELGWANFGRATFTAVSTSNVGFLNLGNYSSKNRLYGFDALVGVAFVQSSFDLFLKAGALIQSMETHTIASVVNPFTVFPVVGPVLFDTLETKTTSTAVLPEIKVGAGYNMNENWTIMASLFIAVGSSPRVYDTFDIATGRSTTSTNLRNPTVGGILLGVQYTV